MYHYVSQLKISVLQSINSHSWSETASVAHVNHRTALWTLNERNFLMAVRPLGESDYTGGLCKAGNYWKRDSSLEI